MVAMPRSRRCSSRRPRLAIQARVETLGANNVGRTIVKKHGFFEEAGLLAWTNATAVRPYSLGLAGTGGAGGEPTPGSGIAGTACAASSMYCWATFPMTRARAVVA